jgi:hypothetical protein
MRMMLRMACIRQHTSAYVSIRQHTSANCEECEGANENDAEDVLELAQRQYLYFCTGKASKLSTCS